MDDEDDVERLLASIDLENPSFLEDAEPPVWDARKYATREEADAALEQLFNDVRGAVARHHT